MCDEVTVRCPSLDEQIKDATRRTPPPKPRTAPDGTQERELER